MGLVNAVFNLVPRGLPIVRAPVQAVLRSVFGPPPIDGSKNPGDPGLFGPGSASWKILGAPPGIVGGIRALMLQLLHPGAMAGVADHSRYEDDPLERLQNTASYVAIVGFGSMPEVLAVTGKVRRAHEFVRGVRPDGLPYSAEDPHLLAWVSIALTDSFLAAYEAYGPTKIDAATADAFVAEQSRAAALLDPRVDLDRIDVRTSPLPMLEDATLPQTRDELEAAIDRYFHELALNEQSSKTMRFLLWPSIPAPLRAGYLPLMTGAIVTLSNRFRTLLNVPPATPADAAIRANTRAALNALRIVAGRSGALAAAEQRLGI